MPVLILPACKRGKYPPEKRQSREKCPLKREKINEPACKKKEMSAGEEKKEGEMPVEEGESRETGVQKEGSICWQREKVGRNAR